MIYESYRCLFPKEYAANPKEFDTQVTITLAIRGPKVSYKLSGLSVEIFPGFLCDV